MINAVEISSFEQTFRKYYRCSVISVLLILKDRFQKCAAETGSRWHDICAKFNDAMFSHLRNVAFIIQTNSWAVIWHY
jgi:hypothetical protein